MSIINIKHEVSDPAFYHSLISAQKKKAHQKLNDPKEWLELGRLYEARLEMIKVFAKRKFLIRWILPLTCLCFFVLIAVFYFNFPLLHPGIISAAFIICAFIMILMGFVRYPRSGIKYFRKAIALDPKCADAYMYLGVIALRRYQKKKACICFELAVKLKASKKNKIEQELKSIYEKELISLFKNESEKDVRHREIVDHQLNQIKTLRIQKANLEKRVESLTDKLDQARWDKGRKNKMMEKKEKSHISAIRQDYEDQIAALKQEAKEEANELAARDFVRLTTEVMESKADLEAQSLEVAAQAVEDMIGRDSWQALSKQTRLYLSTAEHVYTVLSEQEETPDYSLVGMELCKALEVELNRKLIKPFVGYLKEKKSDFLRINQTGKTKDGPSYYTYLARVADQTNYPEVTSLTLGQCHFALKLALEGDYALSEFANFLDQTCAAFGAVIGRAFLERLETVTHRYRNAISHQSPMNKEEYGHLRMLVFAGDKGLLKIVAPCSRRSRH